MIRTNLISTDRLAKLKPEQVVEGAQEVLDDGWGFIHGALGQVWTEEKQAAVEENPYGREQTKLYGRKWIGRRVVDGSGLITWIFGRRGWYMPHGCNGIYNRFCDQKGELKDFDILRPGCLVFKRNEKYENPFYHVGVYVGNGKVIEAHGTAKGVVQSSLFGWSHYGFPKCVEW